MDSKDLEIVRKVLLRDRDEPFGGDEELKKEIGHIITMDAVYNAPLQAKIGEVQDEKQQQAFCYIMAFDLASNGITYTELGLTGYMGSLSDVLILEHRFIMETIRYAIRKRKEKDLKEYVKRLKVKK